MQLNGRVTHTLFTDRYIGTTFFESSLAGCVNPDFLVNSVEFWSEPINWMLRSPPVRRAEGTPESDEYSSGVRHLLYSVAARGEMNVLQLTCIGATLGAVVR